MIASQNGHTETVKCLIDAKAQLDLQSNASIIYHVAKYILILKHEYIDGIQDRLDAVPIISIE